MIGRPFKPARGDVDRARAAARRQLGPEQHVIDAQAQVALESVHAVVPPSERLLRLGKHPEAVLQSQAEETAEGFALAWTAQHLSFPGLGVVDILVGGRDVVVAEHSQTRGSLQLPAKKIVERREPIKLVTIFVGLYRLSVWNVGTNDAQTVGAFPHGRGDDALLLVGESRNARSDIGKRDARQYGDPVIGFLAGKSAAITCLLDLNDRELRVLQLGFLQADDFGRLPCKPVEQVRKAHLEGVNVPGCELHPEFPYRDQSRERSLDPRCWK